MAVQGLLEDLKGICEKYGIRIVDTTGVFYKDSNKLFHEVVIAEGVIEVLEVKNEE